MSQQKDSISPMAKAKGLGSAKHGVHHWWVQRLTALANIPLMLWVMCHMTSLIAQGAPLIEVRAWVSEPVTTVLLVLLLINVPYHAALGLQVVIEDYVTCKVSKYALLIGTKFVLFAGAVAGIVSVLKMAFA